MESALFVGHSHRQVEGHVGSDDSRDGGRRVRGVEYDDNDEAEDVDRSVVECGQASELILDGPHAKADGADGSSSVFAAWGHG